ncbi:TPA: hypothetical protein LVM22_001133 [Klebsiella oxytoca]|nr:hypothetical protein [Klebsiella oxytoca]
MKIPRILTEYRLLTLMYFAVRFAIRLVFTGPALAGGLLYFLSATCLLVTGTAESTLVSQLQQMSIDVRSVPEGHIMQERCRPLMASGEGPVVCERVPVSFRDHARHRLEEIIRVWAILSFLTLLFEIARLLRHRHYEERGVITLRSVRYRYDDE